MTQVSLGDVGVLGALGDIGVLCVVGDVGVLGDHDGTYIGALCDALSDVGFLRCP